MSKVFPEPIVALPKADIPVNGIKAFLSQGLPIQRKNLITRELPEINIKIRLERSEFKGCSPFHPLCILLVNCHAIACLSHTNRGQMINQR